MSAALLAIAVHAGFPLIQKILAGKLGDANGQLASEIINAIAARAGVTPNQLETVDESRPGAVIDAMRVVETAIAPEQIALYMKELENQQLIYQSESEEPLWTSAWRPAGMYLIGFLWLWNTVLLHVANAIWRIALPPVPFDQLLQLSGLYMGLYMGGHTVKDVVAKWVGVGK